MPVVTYLSDAEVRRGLSHEADPDLDSLLKELNAKSGRRWVVLTYPVYQRGWFGKTKLLGHRHDLYLDCHGEWQIINLATGIGRGPSSTLFNSCWRGTRENVLNYMLGYLGGLEK